MSSIDLGKKQRLVYEVIQEFPDAANNEVLLLEQVWLREGWNENRSLYDNLSRVSRPETLSRRRRELYNMGLINYSDNALNEREEAFRNERERPKAVAWMD